MKSALAAQLSIPIKMPNSSKHQIISNQVIAFSGILQALKCVDEIAYKGTTNTFFLETSLESLLVTNQQSADDVYPNLQGLKKGLSLLNHQLVESFGQEDMLIAQYLAAVLHLSKKLNKYPKYLENIKIGIGNAIELKEDYPVTHLNMQARLAGIYSDTISKITPRIMVKGEPSFLQDSNQINKIRSLLLAAVRNALLWKFYGGSKWSLLFSRKKYALEVQEILKKLD